MAWVMNLADRFFHAPPAIPRVIRTGSGGDLGSLAAAGSVRLLCDVKDCSEQESLIAATNP